MTDDLYERYKEALRVGHVSVLRGSLAAAVDAYRTASDIAPTRALPHTSLGGVLLRLGRLEEALVEYAAAVARAPHDEGALLGQAEALSTAGQRVDAAGALDQVAEIQAASGRLPEAADTLRRAIEFSETEDRARRQRELLREIRLSAGDHAAEQLLARALRLRDDVSDARPAAVSPLAPPQWIAQPIRLAAVVEAAPAAQLPEPEAVAEVAEVEPAETKVAEVTEVAEAEVAETAAPTEVAEPAVASVEPAEEAESEALEPAASAGLSVVPDNGHADVGRPEAWDSWWQDEDARAAAQASEPTADVEEVPASEPEPVLAEADREDALVEAVGDRQDNSDELAAAIAAQEAADAESEPEPVQLFGSARSESEEEEQTAQEAEPSEPEPAQVELAAARAFEGAEPATARPDEMELVALAAAAALEGQVVGVMEAPQDGTAPADSGAPSGDELLAAAEAADLSGNAGTLRSLLLWTAQAYAREGRFEAALDAAHRLLKAAPSDVDTHLVLVELYMARDWNALAAEKLALLERLAVLSGDEDTRKRVCTVASRAFPRDERLGALCS